MKINRCPLLVLVMLAICFVFGIQLTAEASAPRDLIRWQKFKEGILASKSMQKPMLLHFYSNNCRFCDMMDNETFRNAEAVDMIRRAFIPVRVNIDVNQKLSDSFRVRGVPDTWFINHTGKIYGHRPGYIKTETFLKILKTVLKQSDSENRTLKKK